jgi:RNA polymerase sigma-70 factor (ECF subfamily)
MEDLTDKELIKHCQTGNPRYQRMLVDQYSGMLMATCLRYCRNQEDAQDCLQEAWIKILKSIDKYQHTGSFKAWMQRIAINCALTIYRKTASIIRIEANRIESPRAHPPNVYSELNADEILKIIHQLSEIKRHVFTLYVIEGYKHTEIAELLEITDSTSRSILTRARQEIREMIQYYDKALEL